MSRCMIDAVARDLEDFVWAKVLVIVRWGLRRLGQVHRDHHTGGDVLLGDDIDVFPGSVGND